MPNNKLMGMKIDPNPYPNRVKTHRVPIAIYDRDVEDLDEQLRKKEKNTRHHSVGARFVTAASCPLRSALYAVPVD